MEKLPLLVRSVVKSEGVLRVFHTFWQAAGGVLLSGLLLARSSVDVKLAFGAALAAGFAAVKALVVARKG